MLHENDFSKKTVTIEKILDAPIELVWDAWTIPEHIVKWWNPNGSNTKIEKHEFRVGGSWKYTMLMPDGNPFIAEGTYTEIIHHELISSKADFKPMTEGVIIKSTFKAVGQKTAFTFYIIHPTEEYKIQQENMGIQNGWGSVFSRLDEFLTTIKL